ncbi:hypothetical protein M0R45_016398 [Rubus argutus]|uniref:Serpin domain-containing protein n=1 Tax=Rubus argutus TaxID=59490 RepID=A0AAW1XT96_RUBAR
MQGQMLSFLKSKSINEINDLISNVVPLVFANGSSKGGPLLSFANGVWVEKTIHVKPGFKKILDTTYKAALNQVDFITRAEEVRCEVKSWAENETKGLIKEIIPAGSVNSGIRLILANALYFKGSWEQKFDESMTRMDNFYLPNGRSVKATFMSSWNSQFVSAFEGFKVLKLPYEQGRDYERHFSMYVFLPNARNGLQALVERVCSESGFIDGHLPKHKAGGKFLIPKFKISADFDAGEVLNHLGLRLNGLTEIVEGEDPAVTNILHKAYMDVNEEGTEAAAITGPFLYLIREEVTGTVMFIGHVLNPIAEEAI